MGQWGKEKKVNGSIYLPHVKTAAFNPIGKNSIVDSIFLSDSKVDENIAENTLRCIRETYVGKQYTYWLSMGDSENF